MSETRTLTASTLHRIVWPLLGLIGVIGALALTYFLGFHENANGVSDTLLACAAGLPLAALFSYLIVWPLRAKLVLKPDALEAWGAFRKTEFRRDGRGSPFFRCFRRSMGWA
jgi:hypothetical protein